MSQPVVSILSVFPQLYDPFLSTSLLKRAQEEGTVAFSLADYFSYVPPKTRIDAPTFGHGAGMLLKPEVVEAGITDLEARHGKAYKIFFSPHGTKLTQSMAVRLASVLQERKHLMLLPARYEGMDARVEQTYADEIISVGDVVLMGGDIPAMMLLEAMLRHIPGVVGKQDSVRCDSFTGPFVDYPEYTAPVVWQDQEVPEAVRSGNHAQLEAWRRGQACKRTVLGHFAWLRSHVVDRADCQLVQKEIPSHYVALMHGQVKPKPGVVGTTSVTTIDIHDLARSTTTYGVKELAIVTPVVDQQKIVRRVLDFWWGESGQLYNPTRYEAFRHVQLMSTLDEVVAHITQKEGVAPLVVATSAQRSADLHRCIGYNDQGRVWALGRPVLILFGTGHGLSDELMDAVDFILDPVGGLPDFKHLSVRSAAAIVLDRWLGIGSGRG